MDWQTIRAEYPNCWVVIEALDAYTSGTQRIVENLEVIGVFGSDFVPAWEHYKSITDGVREFYVVHTARPELNIGIMDSFHRIPSEK
ncbi:MAG: hypothetical protein BroJett018_38700 [Chloroflexota bacterium]|nr:hypothetical protein [Chloroflexota bacterium]NOG64528.1 hypothetical protein [Chloroflexota bacterium]GIK66076.1 MAG: hypothetical protein BroJett018_38700 [Chloroflexota bacterium]